MKKFLTAFVFLAVLIVLSVSAAELSNFSFDIVFEKEAVSYVRFLDSDNRDNASTISGVKFSLASENTDKATAEQFYIDYRIYGDESVSMLFVPGSATGASDYQNDGAMLVSKDGKNKLNYNVEIGNVENKISEFTSENPYINKDVPIERRTIGIDNAEGGEAMPDNPLEVSMTVHPPKNPDTGEKGFVSGQYTGYAILTITSGGD